MKTISENYNGKVIKTSDGFAVKNAVNYAKKYAKSINADINVETAKTGSVYITISSDNNSVDMRISNHTKRGQDMFQIESDNNKVIKSLEADVVVLDTFYVCNRDTYELMKTMLNKLV